MKKSRSIFAIILISFFIFSVGCGSSNNAPVIVSGQGSASDKPTNNRTIEQPQILQTQTGTSQDQGSQILNQGTSTIQPSGDQITNLADSSLRGISQKSSAVQDAGLITAKAHLAVMKMLKPGTTEANVTDLITSTFNQERASGEAFPSIVGSGPNSLILHYTGGTRTIVINDLVVVDIGAKFSDYCADITRTYPAGGKFTPRQLEIYKLVLDAQTAAASQMKPGVQSLDEMTSFVLGFFRQSSLRAKDGSGQETTMDNFFNHGLSHFVGTEVHDAGDTGAPVQVGDVFTIEPGIYIENENIGIRIEDDYIMTESGAKKLVPGLPSDPVQIEGLMGN